MVEGYSTDFDEYFRDQYWIIFYECLVASKWVDLE